MKVPQPKPKLAVSGTTAARTRPATTIGLALLALSTVASTCSGPAPPAPRILLASKIITMDPARPMATAVAIENGRIVTVGSLDQVRAELGGRAFTIDDSLADKVLIAGFIDPHIHPMLAAVLLSLDIVSAVEWATPLGRTPAVRGREAFLARVRQLERERSVDDGDEDEDWLMVWGYHAPYHGALARNDLDEISQARPIMVWQRSVHEMYFNRVALDRLGLTKAALDAHPQADWATGRLWERGLLDLGGTMKKTMSRPTRILGGLRKMNEMLHRGGLTTVAEQGFPQVSAYAELAALHFTMWRYDAPYRFVLVPNAMQLFFAEGSASAARDAADHLLRLSTERVRVIKHAKYFADGAIYSQLMQMSQPYLDGHHGEWMMQPEEQRAVLQEFWQQGWDLHVHVNGDAGLDLVLDQVEERRRDDPTLERRVVLEHYGYAREDQHARVRQLDIEVSNNPYYVYELAPVYAEQGLGPERAADISPLGGLARAGVPTSFHSDYLMAPAEPLTLVWAAVNRLGSDGRTWGEDQKLSLDLALRAVTIEAAASIGLEDEIGSIEIGKRADFTVLERDPYAVEPEKLRDIPLWGTIRDGRAFPISKHDE